jgi:hypothetical protein
MSVKGVSFVAKSGTGDVPVLDLTDPAAVADFIAERFLHAGSIMNYEL